MVQSLANALSRAVLGRGLTRSMSEGSMHVPKDNKKSPIELGLSELTGAVSEMMKAVDSLNKSAEKQQSRPKPERKLSRSFSEGSLASSTNDLTLLQKVAKERLTRNNDECRVALGEAVQEMVSAIEDLAEEARRLAKIASQLQMTSTRESSTLLVAPLTTALPVNPQTIRRESIGKSLVSLKSMVDKVTKSNGTNHKETTTSGITKNASARAIDSSLKDIGGILKSALSEPIMPSPAVSNSKGPVTSMPMVSLPENSTHDEKSAEVNGTTRNGQRANVPDKNGVAPPFRTPNTRKRRTVIPAQDNVEAMKKLISGNIAGVADSSDKHESTEAQGSENQKQLRRKRRTKSREGDEPQDSSKNTKPLRRTTSRKKSGDLTNEIQDSGRNRSSRRNSSRRISDEQGGSKGGTSSFRRASLVGKMDSHGGSSRLSRARLLRSASAKNIMRAGSLETLELPKQPPISKALPRQKSARSTRVTSGNSHTVSPVAASSSSTSSADSVGPAAQGANKNAPRKKSFESPILQSRPSLGARASSMRNFRHTGMEAIVERDREDSKRSRDTANSAADSSKKDGSGAKSMERWKAADALIRARKGASLQSVFSPLTRAGSSRSASRGEIDIETNKLVSTKNGHREARGKGRRSGADSSAIHSSGKESRALVRSNSRRKRVPNKGRNGSHGSVRSNSNSEIPPSPKVAKPAVASKTVTEKEQEVVDSCEDRKERRRATMATSSYKASKSKAPPRRLQRAQSDRNVVRQQKLVRKSMPKVEKFAKKIMKESQFLNTKTESSNSIALLSRREIQVGEILGVGSYSIAYAVTGIKLLGDADEDSSLREPAMDSEGCFNFLDDCAIEEKREARLAAQDGALDENGNYRFAIKHVKQELLADPDEFRAALADLAVEANYLSKFDHPNILKVRGLVAGGMGSLSDGRHDSFFLMTDRLEQTLGRRMQLWKDGGREEENKLVFKIQIAIQIGNAVEYLHENSIIYRDLKPENVGFILDDKVQLFDFGLSRDLPLTEAKRLHGDNDEALYLMSRAGSPRYMAPEIKNTGLYNLKADVYSWSILCYELLSMKKSYPGWTLEELEEQVYRHAVRPPLEGTDLPVVVQDIIVHTWEHDVGKRWTMERATTNCKKALVAIEKTGSGPVTSISSPVKSVSKDEDIDSDFEEMESICTKADTASAVSFVMFNHPGRAEALPSVQSQLGMVNERV